MLTNTQLLEIADPDSRAGFDLVVGLCEMIHVLSGTFVPAIWLWLWIVPLRTIPSLKLGLFGAVVSNLIAVALLLWSTKVAFDWKTFLRRYSIHFSPLVGSIGIAALLISVAMITKSHIEEAIKASGTKFETGGARGLANLNLLLLAASAGYLFKCPWDHALTILEKQKAAGIRFKWTKQMLHPPLWLRVDREKKANAEADTSSRQDHSTKG